MFTLKTALIASSLIAAAFVSAQAATARTVWYGPGSGPFSPYPAFKGWAQIQRQPTYFRPVWNSNIATNPSTGRPIYHCVPNVGLVGANGVCPD